jgi:hypothetical protein
MLTGNVHASHIVCAAMMFTKRLRDGVRNGDITCSIRIWRSPRVKVGGLYPMEEGHIVIESIERIALEDITGELARRSGFAGVIDLLKVARHGGGSNVYLVEFQYIGPAG